MHERHRHRYEVNNHYRPALVKAGLVVSGTFQAGRLVEIVELPDHPWFVASQFHPEFKSRPTRPAPLFRDFVGAALARARERIRRRRSHRLSAHIRSRDGLRGRRPLHRARRDPEPAGRGARGCRRRRSRYLRDLGLTVDEDDAGAEGRLEHRESLLPRSRRPTAATPIFLCAHLDTVPPEGPIEPVIEDGVVRNAAGTILGADNKSAVAAMLEATRRVLAENRPHGGIELLFTPKEEVGLLGAAAFDHERLQARLGYVYDQAAPIGDVILGAPYSQAMRGALPRAGRALGHVPRGGPLGDRGRGARDLGPPAGPHRRGDDGERRHRSAAEPPATSSPSGARSSPRRAPTTSASSTELVQEMVDAFSFAAGLEDCEVETKVSQELQGLSLQARTTTSFGSRIAALEQSGYEPTYGLSGGAADANVFNERGLACLNLANGMQTSTRPTSTSPSRTSRGWSKSRSRWSMPLAMLTLRRGRVTAIVERVDGLVANRGRRRARASRIRG